MSEKSIYEFSAKLINGKEISMVEYKGKVLLIVNVASKCGFTPQYKGLEEIYKKYRGQGFEILAFPCNQFGAQEPGDEAEIKSFCELNYSTTFPLFSKVDVNGSSAHSLFEFLKHAQKGLLGTTAIKWNFTKFLVSRDGEVIERYAPTTEPANLAKDIETQLSSSVAQSKVQS